METGIDSGKESAIHARTTPPGQSRPVRRPVPERGRAAVSGIRRFSSRRYRYPHGSHGSGHANGRFFHGGEREYNSHSAHLRLRDSARLDDGDAAGHDDGDKPVHGDHDIHDLGDACNI